LVARVFVNRVWMHHFGPGLVATPSDFGAMGERPTHPELLDWLATDFVEHGWRLKRLHKLIMTSTAYRQSSSPLNGVRGETAHVTRHLKRPTPRSPSEDQDPENRLYWRKPIQRLDAEVIRDSMLAVSGALNEKMFGPPVPVRPDVNGQIVVGIDKTEGDNKMPVDVSLQGEEFRRSIYIQVRRSRPLAMLHAFDEPVMEVNCERRQSSTVPTQSLMMMNSQFVLDQAARFAQRLQKEAGDDPARQIARAWQLALSRSPGESELTNAQDFFSRQVDYLKTIPEPKEEKPAKGEKPKPVKPTPELQALTDLCQALLSSNEFLYVD